MKKIFLILMLIAITIPSISLATDNNTDMNVIEISDIDGDYTLPKNYPILYILFTPGAAGDKAIIKISDTNGPVVAQMTSNDNTERIVYLSGKELKLFIDETNSTFSSGAILSFVAKGRGLQ